MNRSPATGLLSGFVVVILALLLAGCGYDPPTDGVMVHRPVRVVVDPYLPECQKVAVRNAIEFWRDLGLAIFEVELRLDHHAKVGDVVVLATPIDDPNTLGRAWRHYKVLRPGRSEIIFAEIHLASCLPRVAAHEIGHALGLGHRNVEGALMHRDIALGGWGLVGEELDRVGLD